MVNIKDKIRTFRIQSKLELFNNKIRLAKFSLKKYDTDLDKNKTVKDIINEIKLTEDSLKCKCLINDFKNQMHNAGLFKELDEFNKFTDTIQFENLDCLDTLLLDCYKAYILANIFCSIKNVDYTKIKDLSIDELEDFFDNRIDIDNKNKLEVELSHTNSKPFWKFW